MNTNEARKMNTQSETKTENEACPLDAIVNPPCNEVFLMDCMEGMKQYPDKFFDIAIVDPPYGNGTKADVGTGEYSRNWVKNRNGDWDIRPADIYWQELRRVSKNQIVFGANFFPLPPSRGYVCWYKTDEVKGRDFSEFEIAYTSFDKPARIFECKPFIRGGKRIHPTQKPLKLYDWLIMNYAEDCETILDTHVGSGSSRIAAHKAGKSFVGFEIDKDYHEAQEKRFKEFKKQLTLF